jgi:hypothetical protein
VKSPVSGRLFFGSTATAPAGALLISPTNCGLNMAATYLMPLNPCT